MGSRLSEKWRQAKRLAATPVGDAAAELPRIVAQGTVALLPLWLSYRENLWIFGVLLVSVITIGSYRVFGKSPESQRLNRRRVYARSTAKILENIRDCILGVREADATGSQSAILRIIVDRTRDMVGGADAGSISANLMVRQGPSALKTIAVDQPTKGRGKSEISLDSPGAGHALRSGEAVYIDDVKELGKAFREDAPYRSILSIPIRSGDDLIGAVSIDSTEPRHFYAGIHDHLDPYVQLLGLLLCIPARGTA